MGRSHFCLAADHILSHQVILHTLSLGPYDCIIVLALFLRYLVGFSASLYIAPRRIPRSIPGLPWGARGAIQSVSPRYSVSPSYSVFPRHTVFGAPEVEALFFGG